MSATIQELIELVPRGNGSYESARYPEKMANTANIAYGGCVLAMAVNAACQSVPSPEYKLYSILGYYLGGTLTTEKVTIHVENIRSTRTFATRKVEARQKQKGQERTTFYLITDFMVPNATAMTYSIAPRRTYPKPHELQDHTDYIKSRIDAGLTNPKLVHAFDSVFTLWMRFLDEKPCPETHGAQNLLGIDKKAITTQENLPITEKLNAFWFKFKPNKQAMTSNQQNAALAFILDAAIAFLPASFTHAFLDDYAAISSLDCSLRFHRTDFDVNDWLLCEQFTEVAAEGRSWSVSRAFNIDGVLVATMTQSAVLKPKPGAREMKL